MAKKPAKNDQDDDGLSREEYFAERSLLIDARQRGFQRAEQMVAGGATGALLLSVTFVEKLAPGSSVHWSGALVTAWATLLGSLSASLLGQYASARAFDCEIARLEATIHKETPPKNSWRTCNSACGYVSASLLVAGIALLASFAYINAPFQPWNVTPQAAYGQDSAHQPNTRSFAPAEVASPRGTALESGAAPETKALTATVPAAREPVSTEPRP